jgi:hypothetical protein
VIGYAKYVKDNCSAADYAILKKVWLQYYSMDWRKLTAQRETQKVWTDLQSMMDDFVAGLQALHLKDLREDKYDYGLPFDIRGYWRKEGEPHYWRHPLYYVLDKDQTGAMKTLLWLIKEEDWHLPKTDDPPQHGDEELQSAVRPTSKADWKKDVPKAKARAGKKQREKARHVKSQWYDKPKPTPEERGRATLLMAKAMPSKSTDTSAGSSWEQASSHQAGPSTTAPVRQYNDPRTVAFIRVPPTMSPPPPKAGLQQHAKGREGPYSGAIQDHKGGKAKGKGSSKGGKVGFVPAVAKTGRFRGIGVMLAATPVVDGFDSTAFACQCTSSWFDVQVGGFALCAFILLLISVSLLGLWGYNRSQSRRLTQEYTMRETPAPTVDAQDTPVTTMDPREAPATEDNMGYTFDRETEPPPPPFRTLRQRWATRRVTSVRIEKYVRTQLVFPSQLWVSDNAFKRNDLAYHLSPNQCRYANTIQTIRPIRFCKTCFLERTGTLMEDIVAQATADQAVVITDDPVDVFEFDKFSEGDRVFDD